MTPQLAAALNSGRASVTGLFQIDFPTATRRLLLGSTQAKWGADTFKGYDPDFGHVDSGDELREDVSGNAPNTSISVVPARGVDKAAIAGPQVQLSPFKIWLAALQKDGSGHIEVVPDPEPLFDGFIDQATINLGEKRDDIDYTLVSPFDYFFEDGEGQRLNGQFHRSRYAGEQGLDNVTGLTKKIYWGANPPGGVGSSGSTSIYGGGGGGGGERFGFHVSRL